MYKILASSLITSVVAVSLMSLPAQAGSGSATAQTDETMYKDLSPQQRSVATGLPQVSSTETASTDALRISVDLDRDSREYRIGDTLSLSINVSEDAYVEVWNVGTSGKVTRIFPNAFAQDNHVKAGQTVSLPGAGAEYEFAVMEPQGWELVTVFASDQPESPTRDFIASAEQSNPFPVLRPQASALVKDLHPVIQKAHPRSTFVHKTYQIVK